MNRWKSPQGIIAEAIAQDPTFAQVTFFYLILALIACALLVPTLAGLAAGAAVLGARGRERRLAALVRLRLRAPDPALFDDRGRPFLDAAAALTEVARQWS